MNHNSSTNSCRLTIDYGECAACAACAAVCHSFALNMAALTLELNGPLCNNCSLCVYVCPTGALALGENASKK